MNKSWAAIEIANVKKEFPRNWGRISKTHLMWALAGRLAKAKREISRLKKLAS